MSLEEKAAQRQKLRKSDFVSNASNAMNSRFSDMFKAFQYVDLDRSGTLDEKEIPELRLSWPQRRGKPKRPDVIVPRATLDQRALWCLEDLCKRGTLKELKMEGMCVGPWGAHFIGRGGRIGLGGRVGRGGRLDLGFRLASGRRRRVGRGRDGGGVVKTFVKIGERTREVELTERLGELIVHLDGEPCEVDYAEADNLGQVILIHGGKSYAMSIEGSTHEVAVTIAGHRYDLSLEDERERAANLAAKAAAKGGGTVKAVMPGVVVELLVEPGQEVSEGEPLLILEAMKMQNEIGAPGDGVVKELHAEPGTAVGAGDKLVTLVGKDG